MSCTATCNPPYPLVESMHISHTLLILSASVTSPSSSSCSSETPKITKFAFLSFCSKVSVFCCCLAITYPCCSKRIFKAFRRLLVALFGDVTRSFNDANSAIPLLNFSVISAKSFGSSLDDSIASMNSSLFILTTCLRCMPLQSEKRFAILRYRIGARDLVGVVSLRLLRARCYERAAHAQNWAQESGRGLEEWSIFLFFYSS